MAAVISAPDAAKRLGIGATTLRTWAEKFRLGERNGDGWRLFSEQDMHLFSIILSLRDQDRSFDTITRRLREVTGGDSASQPDIAADSGPQASGGPPKDVEAEGGYSVLLPSDIERVTNLAREYARSAHRIGELEEKVRHLEQLRDQQQHLLAGGDHQVEDLQRALHERDLQLARADEQIKHLQASQAQGKTWWQKLLGR